MTQDHVHHFVLVLGAQLDAQSAALTDFDSSPDRDSGYLLDWNFLDKHEATCASNPRISLMIQNLTKLLPGARQSIKQQVKELIGRLEGV